MKHLQVVNFHFQDLEQNFKEWLSLLGYSSRTVKGSSLQIRELLYFLEQKNISQITAVKASHIYHFINHLHTRSNLKYGGGLSSASINSYLTSLRLFVRYLNKTGQHELDIITRRLPIEAGHGMVLTQAEIKSLYTCTFEPYPVFNSRAMGQRDRAIIALFYGCGLRKAEGSRLNVDDIDLEKRLVLVKKGKGNKQRYVPVASRHGEDIRTYMEEGRYWFLQDNRTWYVKKGFKKQNAEEAAFFLNTRGQRMQSFYHRLEYLKNKAAIGKPFSTHTLRHSIATHLLQRGMPLEEIAKFLGHSTLESTQVYTHLMNELTPTKDEQSPF